MKPLTEVFLKTEGVNEGREVWDAGGRPSSPGQEGWRLTENPDQCEETNVRNQAVGGRVPRIGRDLITGVTGWIVCGMWEILTPENENIYIRKETMIRY